MESSSIAATIAPVGEYSDEDYWFLLLSELGSEGSTDVTAATAAAALQVTQRSDDGVDYRSKSCIINEEEEQKDRRHRPQQRVDGFLHTTSSTTDTATVVRHGPIDQVEIEDGLRDDSRISGCIGGYSGMTAVWEESEECISDRIEFIFCNNFEFDGYDYSDCNEGDADDNSSSSSYGNMFKFTIPLALQPTLRLALDYVVRSISSARNTAHDTALMLQRLSLRDDGLQQSSSQLSSWVRYPSNVHDNMLFLARHLQAGSLRQLVSTSTGGIVHLRDIAVAKLAQYIRSNIYLTSLVGCVHESTLFMVDRIQAGVELYAHLIQADDPAHIHLRTVRDSPDWKHLLLRCSMASLTWRQRQLLEETRDGGSLSDADLKQLMEAQVTDHDRQRIAGISSEFFASLSGDRQTTAAASAMSIVRLKQSYGYGSSREPLDEMQQEQQQQGTMDALEDDRSLDHLVRHNSSSSSSSNRCFQSGEVIDPDLQSSSGDDGFQSNVHVHSWLIDAATDGDEDAQYALAKFFTPPPFSEQSFCAICIDKVFSIVSFRHHCRFCGRSVCHEHSPHRRCIYRFGIVQPVRVCSQCVVAIDATHLMDELIWKDLRVSSFLASRLIPYSHLHPSVDRSVDKVMRVTNYSLSVAKNALAFNFTAKFALDTLDVLKRYGLTGFTGLLLRKDFMESICMLMKISGMESIIALSIHELTACVYYKLAIERGIRGCNPDSELLSHAPTALLEDSSCQQHDRTTMTSSSYYCRSADTEDIDHAISLAPLALNIVYEEDPADCQRLARLQGWDMIFTNSESDLAPEQPCFTLFGCSFPTPSLEAMDCAQGGVDSSSSPAAAAAAAVSGRQLQAVLAIRGTQTIQDVVTDIKASPQLFPPPHDEIQAAIKGLSGPGAAHYREESKEPGSPSPTEERRRRRGSQSPPSDWDWLSVPLQHTYACGGMVRAAMYVLKEVGPALRRLHAAGYQVTMVGHSLGGAVAALLTLLLEGCIPSIRCITYGCPSCVDSLTADLMLKSRRVLSVVLRDDVICRITPQSIRLLLRELVVFREEMFQHLQQEWMDILTRASSLWSPRLRNGAAGGSGSSLSKLDSSAHYMSSKSSGASSIDKATVIVEEEALTQLWIPGRIIHIYRHRGQYYASEVSRDFPELRTIAMQGNIFDDHRSEKIFNALLEVRAVRRASRAVPAWVPFNACDPISGEGLRCSCCSSDFSWHSTFTGQAQDFRDKFNCRYCGRLVCGPCSSHSRAMPQYGFVFPKRICDQCLYKGDFANV